MQKEVVLGLLLSMSTPCFSEVRFIWDVSASTEKKQILENKIKEIATNYTKKKYADDGAYNFFTAKEKFVVHIIQQGGYYDTSTNHMDISYLPSPLIDLEVMHEFSHAYDDAMDIENSLKEWQAEGRACKKEHWFMDEIKNKMPLAYYKRFKACVKGETDRDYWNTYICQGPIWELWVAEVREEE